MSLDFNKMREKAIKKVGDNHPKNTKESVKFPKPWHDGSVLFVEENAPKIGHKSDENEKNKTGNKVGTNREQTGNKQGTKWEQSGNKIDTNWEQSRNKLGTQPGTQVGTNWEQTRNKVGTFSSLMGLQRKILLTIFSSSKTSRTKITEPLSLEYISNCSQMTVGCAKTSIKRLRKKGFITTEEYKNGRGGWCKYSIPDFLYQEIILLENNDELGTNWEQTGNKVGTQPGTQPGTTAPSSSSYIYNNTITELGGKEIGEEYKNIDYSLLEKIKFGKTQIAQLFEKKIDPNLIQSSINNFAYGLENNPKLKTHPNPLNYFMGVLLKGHEWIEQGFKTQEEIEIERMVVLRRERNERLESLKKELFKNWFNKVSDNVIVKLCPYVKDNVKHGRHISYVEDDVKKYFYKNVIPKILSKKPKL